MRPSAVAVCLLLLPSPAGAGGEMREPIPDCSMIQDPYEFEACAIYAAELIMEQQEQQQMALMPEQLAFPNQPTTIVVDQGGSNIGEWAALFSGLAALLAALEVLRRRRKQEPG